MSKNGSNILWFVAGGAIGAGIALLYAPKSGRETRRLISRKAERGRLFVVDTGKDVFERGREIYEHGRKIAEEASEILEKGRKLVNA
jgi:gas vesicle protein